MLRVGLTGGIACGKSLVAALFVERGIAVVNDDDASRDAVAPGSEGLAAVVEAFGHDVLAPDGSLDRPRLGRLVFADDTLRRRLMRVTFPFIGKLILERFAQAERSGAPMLVYESALLVENGQVESWRPVVVVLTTPELQVERLRARNGLSEAEARDRIRAQLPLAEKRALADFAIDNSGPPVHTRRQFDEVLARLLERAARVG